MPDPSMPTVFGTTSVREYDESDELYKKYRFVQGGCYGMTLAAAKMVLDSRILTSEHIKDYRNSWWRSGMEYLIELNRISEDRLFGYAANQLGIEMVDHPEILSGKESQLLPDPLPHTCMAVHPHRHAALSGPVSSPKLPKRTTPY
jgi:hypothetical protein